MITVDFNRLDVRPGDRILDIGCGSGRHVSAAYQQPGVTVVGADVQVADLHQARSRLKLHDYLGAHGGGTWHLASADVTALPFAAASFDLVICSEVLEHVPDHRGAAAELVRVLKPGRRLAVSVPRYLPERICWALSRDYAPCPDGGHIRIYRRRRLAGLLRRQGMVPKGGHHAHALHTPYWWLKCLVGPNGPEPAPLAAYQRFLTWDVMQKPRVTRILESGLNPVLGKSLVLYFQKPAAWKVDH